MARRKKHTSLRSGIIIALLILVTLILILSGTLVHLLTEVWWFETVGFSSVFWTLLIWKSLIWLGTFVIFALFLWWNLRLAMGTTPTNVEQLLLRQRSLRSRSVSFLEGRDLNVYAESFSKYIGLVVIILISLMAAGASIGSWETILKYLHASDFSNAEPIYQQDIGFYIFQLPFFESLRNWLLALLICALVVSVPVYILKGSIYPGRSWDNLVSGKTKTHLSILLAAIVVLIAISLWLERYELLYSEEGVVFGAGYTDVHARLTSLWVMSLAALVLAALFVVSVWQNSTALPIYGIGLYLVALVIFRGVYPWFQQQFIVEPNELAKEKLYIANNIEFTRQAYGLETVKRKEYPAKTQLNRQVLQENKGTIDNIRLWDYRPLLSTYRQLQEIRLYYKFTGIDIDRYTLNGNYQQVMLSPRELSYAQVPERARTWVNQRLKYTHGYGLVMSRVNRVTSQGLPEFLIKDIPPVSRVDVQITRPEIYYGEETDSYIFTGTSTDEFDYPRGGENAFTKYSGKGGVPMGSLWRRLAYAYDLGSVKILISNYFTDNSRIHYYRTIKERVSQIVPFLKLDRDPYICVIDGKIKWVIDAYTVSDRYPYSEPVLGDLSNNFNYIRNSVKVVVDAYDGTMQFFVVDEKDPLLATYRKIFPKLFTASQNTPPQLKEHFRYPLDLFAIQAQMYLSYHMSDPEVFYNQEDLWRFPREIYEGNEQLMEPYYMVMRLPQGKTEEFILILPFTPGNKDNMIAWMAAHSNGDNYGKLLLYEFPKQQLVYGPKQIEARIDQNPQISQQLTLWSQQGSKVIRGDLLVIPIQESLLYVEPIYLRAEQGELPELKRVIVAYDEKIVMAESLEKSLALVFDGSEPNKQVPVTINPVTSSLAQSALESFRQAQQALQEGNWAEYGKYQQELEVILEQLNL